MFDDLLERAASLKARDKPFVLATVVACKPPTSAKPGSKAIVQPDGSFHGWVGGSCAQPLITEESLRALQDGRSRLAVLAPDPGAVDLGLEATVVIPLTCKSEGTLAIYLEPSLPRHELVVIGQSPVARSLAALGNKAGFRVTSCDPSASAELFPDAESLLQELDDLRGIIGPRTHVVVATAGHYDEEAVEAVLSGEAGYVGLVASRRRGKAVIDYLRGQGACAGSLEGVKYPAGLDIGAETPEEIALSILTEVVQVMRANPVGVELAPSDEAKDAESTDPICNMTVKVAESRHISNYNGGEVHFCSAGCKVRFEQQPERYPLHTTA